ncbi:mucin-5AC [Sander lucioperca]|uniref:mucin-5AC n=1 Tax=Sander lucioperca TaxID=283035 RepID=UPI00165355C5|nr:mucin-5AC [Sander lucioperca]
MISYVECLGGEGAGPGVGSRCWNGAPDEELDELLPRQIAALQPKTEGSLRRRLLSAKIYQQRSAILGQNAGGVRPSLAPDAQGNRFLATDTQGNRFLATETQGNRFLATETHGNRFLATDTQGNRFLATETYGNRFLATETQGKPFLATETQGNRARSPYPVLSQRGRTGSCPPTPEPRPGYTLPAASPFCAAFSHFVEPEVPPQYRYRPSRRRRAFGFFRFRHRWGRSSEPEAAQTTPLLHTAGDGDRKWSVHYNTQKPQQRLLFFSGKKRSGSTDDLRGQRSTENSVSACNGLTQHGCSPPSAAPQLPFSFGLDQSEGSTARRGWKDKSRRMSSAFSDDEEKFILNNTRPLTPPMLNPAHRSSCWDVFASAHELPEETDTDTDTETETETSPRLPTPEEKMRKQAETVAADIVPINITGESFDRQASFRKVVSNTDSLSRQTRNLSRCKTLAGLPDDVSGKLDWPSDSADSAEPVLPGGFSSAGRRVEENPAPTAERGGDREEGKSSVRRIRAPRGGGMCSLMASLTSAPPTDSSDPSRLPRLPPLPRPDTNSSLDSCGTLSASSSCCQGFHGDLQPLLPSDLAVSPSPYLAISSSYYQGDSYYLSSSSIADADSQFSFQTLHSSDSGDTWNYEPLSPSASDHDGVHGDWSCIATKTRRVSGEGVNSSGRSTPSHADTNSLCSEFSAFSNTSLRKHSTSSSSTLDSCSIGAARSISLRKSTRPPPPPKRSVSLMQHPSRSNTPDTQRSPQTFPDPWVPRTNTQSDFICNAGAFFEPLRPDYHTETCTLSSEQQPPNAGLSNISAAIQRLASPSVQRHQSDFNSNSVHRTETFALSSEHLPPNVSKDQQLRLNLNSETSVSSASAIQGLVSPSVQRRQTDFTSNAVLSSVHFLPNVSKDQQLRLNLSSETFVSSGSAIQRLTSPLIERRQTDFNSNAALSYEHLPPKVSKDQQLRLDLNSETSVSSASAIQELASPSLQRRQSDFNSNAVLSSEHLLPNAGRSNVSKDQQLRLNLNSETSVSSAAVIQGLASSFVQRRQTDFNSNAVLSSEHFPQNVSKDQQLRLDLNAKPSVVSASVAVVQRLPSPSSGYSSQSNTPTPVSPVSPLSPLSPSSPSSFSLPSSSQSSSSHSSSSVPRAHAISSARRSTPRFEAKPKPKPPVPERKSSLSSSSFSSTSSLSSCTSSSDSSAKLPLLPPPPPPLAPSSIATSPLPLAPSSLATSPPPPPPPPLPLAPSSLASSPLPPPPLALSYLPPLLPLSPSSPATFALPPPPPLPLAPSSFPTPPPLPPSSRPPPPPYSSAAKASTILSPSSSTTNTPPPPPSSSPLPFSAELSDLPITDLPPLPPLPPLLPLLPLLPPPPSSLGPRGVPRPLVTAQALQGVKLRSVGKKNGSVSADARPDLEANIHAKLAGTGSPNVACNLASNEANIPSALPSDANLDSTTNSHVKQPGRKSDGDGRSRTKSGTKTPGNASLYDDVPRQNGVVVVSVDNHGHAVDKPCNGKTDRDVEKKEREKEDPDVQMYPAAPDSPWVKISHNSDKSHVSASIKCPSLQRQHATDATLSKPAEKRGNADSLSSCRTLSGTKRESRRANLSQRRDETDANGTKCSAESDLNLSNSACVVVSPEATRSQNGDQILTASSPGLNSQSHCPADSFCTSLHTHVTQSTPATERSTRANVDANCTAIRGESVAKKTSTGSSPQTQNQPILHRKPDHSLISPKTNQPIPAPARTSEAFRGTYGTEVTDNKNAEKRRSERNPNTLKETERIGSLGNSGTFRCFGNASAYGATSAQSEAADPWVIKTRVRKEEEETDRTSRMKSSLAEDEKRREEEEEERARKTSLVMMRQKQRARKRRKRRAGRQQQQLLMMSSTMSSSSSSSSSSLSSSSGDEGERAAAAAAANQRPRMRMTAVSEGSCAVIGQSRALCLPGLRIHEEEEREEEDEEEEEREEEEEGDGLLVRVSADQMFVSEQQRTTEELFTAIHRSKRKILGRRKDSADDRHRISSSSSPAVSLAVPPRPPCPPLAARASRRCC